MNDLEEFTRRLTDDWILKELKVGEYAEEEQNEWKIIVIIKNVYSGKKLMMEYIIAHFQNVL